MRKGFKFDSGEYTVYMSVIEQTETIRIIVYKGNEHPNLVRDHNIIYEERLQESKMKKLFGQTLEKRTTVAVKRAIDYLNKYANKYNGLYKAYDEAKQIFTLDEHMNL